MPTYASIHMPNNFFHLLTICCLITFGCYFAVAMRLPVLPIHARSFGVTTVQIGMINAGFYLMAGVFSLPSGLISKKAGVKRLALYGLACMAAALLLLYFSRSFIQIAALYLLLGIGMAAFGPTMMTLVAEIAPATHLGRAYGWYTTALFCGLSMGPGAAGALAQWVGMRPVFIIATACILINLWAMGMFMPDQHRQADNHRKVRSGIIVELKALMDNQPLMGCWLITFGANVVTGTFFTFIPLHAHDRGLTVAQIGLVFLVNALINAISRIPFGALSDRVPQRKYLVIVGILVVGLAIFGFGVATALHHFLMAAIGLGVGLGLAFTSIGALIAETVHRNQRSSAMGGYNAAIYFGMMIGAMAFGPVIETLGYQGSFTVNGCFMVAFALPFAWLMRGFTVPARAAR